MFFSFYTPANNSDRLLWYHVGRPSVCRTSIRPSVFSFPDDNLSKCERIFTKVGVCIDIFGLLPSNFRQFLTVICLRHDNSPYFLFRMITRKCQWSFAKLRVCIDIVEIWLRTANGQNGCLQHDNGGISYLYVFILKRAYSERKNFLPWGQIISF